MAATTIKVEGELLRRLTELKPEGLSLSAFVRAILQKELLRYRMEEAAERYVEFVRENPDEAEWLAQWERAKLTKPLEGGGE